MPTLRSTILVPVVFLAFFATQRAAEAQPLGTFRWQLQPFCNVVTLNVTQAGSIYTLDGYDDLCGASTRAAVVGTAFQNPNGTIGLGMTLVLTPGATPLNIQATITLANISGAWSDSAGNSGPFVFNPAIAPGSPRPASEALHWVNVNANATLRTASPGLAGTAVLRPAGSPAGVYCIRFPAGSVFTREAAVASLQQEFGGAGVPGLIHVTVSFGSLCNAVGAWNVAVQTYSLTGAPLTVTAADRPFTLLIPRQ
ncbi:MAG: hypothetical protein LC791_09170 [Acidobacteria bacterium]|nr:hypothetical protein [Acidobacteriota bacterium]